MPCRARIRPALALFAIISCAHFLVGMVSGQQQPPLSGSENLDAFLKRMEANVRANDPLAARYTYDETRETKCYNHKGKQTHQNSEKFVSVIIGGLDYNRVVERNGVPVPENRQIAEQKRQDAISELGKSYDFVFELIGLNPRDYIYSDLPVSYLDSLFDNHVIRHELINGRDNLVVESTPKANANPSSDRAKTALDWKETTWIDIEDAMPTRYDIELLNSKKYLLSGSTGRNEFTRLPVTRPGDSRLPPVVWLIHGVRGHYSYKILWSTNSSVTQIDCYNYKRFQSDARVLNDSVQESPQ